MARVGEDGYCGCSFCVEYRANMGRVGCSLCSLWLANPHDPRKGELGDKWPELVLSIVAHVSRHTRKIDREIYLKHRELARR